MDKIENNKPQIIITDKNGLDKFAKLLLSSGWAITGVGSNNNESSTAAQASQSSRVVLNTPQLCIDQNNLKSVVHLKGPGKSGSQTINSGSNSSCSSNGNGRNEEQKTAYERDQTHVVTLTDLGKKLLLAARVGDTSQVRRLMAIGAPFSSEGQLGMSPLHIAAQNGHLQTCEMFLRAGITKDAKNKVGKTPLHLASMEGHTDIVALLLSEGSAVNTQDLLKMTALHWACDRGHTAIVKTLLQYAGRGKMSQQLDTSLKNKFMKTALQLATENNHTEVIKLMKGEGVERNTKEEEAAVESITLDMASGGQVPHPVSYVCKTEEVTTEEVSFMEEVTHVPEADIEMNRREDIGKVIEDLPESIMTDDAEDKNTSVLATLAELAAQTSRGSPEASHEVTSRAALELLRAQASLLPDHDQPSLVANAIEHGQIFQLTEAGRQVLQFFQKEVSENSFLLPPSTMPQPELPSTHDDSPSRNKKTSVGKKEETKARVWDGGGKGKTEVTPKETGESQPVTRVITLSPEQYAALTSPGSGPIIVQVASSSGNRNTDAKEDPKQMVKKQKISQFIAKSLDR
ncbi:ada2a-containing complex component 3 isoform X2 [Oratosquilla oratoria]|uniref:ada2a-containing complex component 3 isoform X2 n=1 Tax=Oratosquilla oratoria TaxID=337810 RepID=UPI003F76E367